MQPHPRYELVEEIASGDFATVYRGRDTELGRDVAIKQIHPQFLADARQLERYWQEAQLLASLEHPNIMTIYDIARDRGWLILELMRGNLLDHAAGQPMDLNFLRVALLCSLNALKFLHANGIVHGDVKPTNLLLDKRNWVKLGDFGLAQRVADDQGSLLKGTTKYMAPERVSDQFGGVGPHSDLYSLGFSIYELMCGAAFESLFPGLSAFGRDRQIAWMMWHAAPDRLLPEIPRVLEGVPDDMVNVVQRLVAKNPAQRYQTADEAIGDLKSGLGFGAAPPSEKELVAEKAEEETKKQKKRRVLLMIAAAVSLSLTVGILFIPTEKPAPPPPARVLKDLEGVLRTTYFPENTVLLDTNDEVTFREGDRLYLNDQAAEITDLKVGDRLVVKRRKDDLGRGFQEIRATRPQEDRGTILSVNPKRGTFRLDADSDTPQEYVVRVPDTVDILFNGKQKYDGKKVQLANLKPDDRVVITHDADGQQRVATSLRVKRIVETVGTIQGIDKKQKTLSVTVGGRSARKVLTLPLAKRVEVTLNGRKFIGGRALSVADLRPDDKVTIDHDTHVQRIEGMRILSLKGKVAALDRAGNRLEVSAAKGGGRRAFMLKPETTIELAGQDIEFSELQSGDAVEVIYDAVDPKNLVAERIVATRPIDRNRWAIVIGVQNYSDKTLTSLTHTTSDAKVFYDALVKRYRIAGDQAILLLNPDREEIVEAIPRTLSRPTADSQVVVYFAGHAYVSAGGKPLLAAGDFALTRMERTGLPVSWLVAELEKCAAKDKLLLLDSCHSGNRTDLDLQPSSAELFETARSLAKPPFLRSAHVIASCQKGQRGLVDESGQGYFGTALALAYSGGADRDGDHLVVVAELLPFVNNKLHAASGGRQSPAHFKPEKIKPPRLSPEAKKAIAQLGGRIGEPRIDLADVKVAFDAASGLAPDEPEPKILLGLALLKAKKHDDAFKQLQSVVRAHPDEIVALEAAIWALFQDRKYRSGITGLSRLVSKLPKDAGEKIEMNATSRRILPWAGKLREFAAVAPTKTLILPQESLRPLDSLILDFDSDAKKLYGRGRDAVRDVASDFDKQMANAVDRAEELQIKTRKRRLNRYVSFSIEAAAQRVIDQTR